EKEALIGGLMEFLVPQKYFVVPDTGWSNWDLKISRGLCSRALVLVCTENHGSAKRLLRVRCAMRLSRFASFLLRSRNDAKRERRKAAVAGALRDASSRFASFLLRSCAAL